MSGNALLRAYKHKSGATQESLAERWGISQALVSLLLAGKATVTRLDLADRIERDTDGAVPASSWLTKRKPAHGRRVA